jgi:signal transduction histidine kinase
VSRNIYYCLFIFLYLLHNDRLWAIDISAYLEILEEKQAIGFDKIPQAAFQPIKDYKKNLRTQQTYWLRLSLPDSLVKQPGIILYAGIWTHIEVFYPSAGGGQRLKGGHFATIQDRIGCNTNHEFQLRQIAPSGIIYLKLRQEMAFYLPEKVEVQLYSAEKAQTWQEARLFYQGVFIGIIYVMAIYNLLVYAAVRDVSWLYYVFSLLGLGLYFQFYYGFTLQYWGHYPIWNAYSFALIVPLTRMAWIRFTQTYLHLSETLPFWHSFLNVLWWIYSVPMLLGVLSIGFGFDLSVLAVNWIGIMGLLVMSMMLATGVLALRQGYQPAWYFLLANLTFSIGSILFIIRETGFLPDNAITRYSVQVGVVIQAVLFSLGLAQRYNATRQALAQQALEKERVEREKEIEKKELIEQQKIALEHEVRLQTADLREKTEELQTMLAKLQESEYTLRELNDLKDKFFSIISHDLRSPLATLNSFLNIIANFSDKLSPAEIQKLTEKTRLSVTGLSDLIDKLLLWARVQMNQAQFSPQFIDLSKIVAEVVALLAVPAEEKQIQLTVAIPVGLQVFADEDMLGFILRNLVVNALKFTASKGDVLIAAYRQGDAVEIKIADTGIGIVPEDLPKLFTYQHHFTTRGTQNEHGTGLGLLLCREFTEKNQGQIRVESEWGQGSTFYVILPAMRF